MWVIFGLSGLSGDSGLFGRTGLHIINHINNPTMDSNKRPTIKHYQDGTASVLRKAVVYTELRFYQRSDVLYQLTQVFCQRFLLR